MAGIMPLTSHTSARVAVENNTLTGENNSRKSPASPRSESELRRFTIGTKIVLCCQRIANRLLDASIVVAEKVQADHVDVVRITEVAHGGKGDVDDAVDAVLAAFLWSGLEHPDYFIRNAAD